MKRDVAERFWEKVQRGASGECWPWKGGRREYGYGRFVVGVGRQVKAHRFAWELERGPIPEGMCVCHSCDNPPCCNPAHLFLGTQADNTKDRVLKGRTRTGRLPGEKNGNAKLTDAQASEIRRRRERGELLRVLAAEFGVSAARVSTLARAERVKS